MDKDIVRAIVVGAAGRMGLRVLAAIHESPNVLLAAAVERPDHPYLGRDIGEVAGLEKWNIPLSGALMGVIASGDVVIEFTNAESSLKNLRVAAEHGKSAGIGSTGFSASQIQEVQGLP